MSVTIDNLLSIPDLPSASALNETDLFHVNQSSVDGKISLLALTAYFMDKAHPIGSVFLHTVKGVNPNIQFAGQTWVRSPNAGRQLRVCAADENDLGTTGGSDTVTVTAANLPAHTHTFRGTTEGGGAHTPSGSLSSNGAHQHSIYGTAESAGAHAHSVTGTAETAGDHSHRQRAYQAGGGGNNAYIDRNVFNTPGNENTSSSTVNAGSHSHSVSGTAGSNGAHTHSITGNANLGGQHGHVFSGDAVAAHTHTFSGTTDSTFAANSTALNVAGMWLKLGMWTRTA